MHLGVLRKNEQYEGDMIEILEYLQPNVPFHDPESNSKPVKVLSGGDYLTFKRHKEAQSSMQDARTPSSRLEGLIPKIEDFHHHAEWMKVTHVILNVNIIILVVLGLRTWSEVPSGWCYNKNLLL